MTAVSLTRVGKTFPGRKGKQGSATEVLSGIDVDVEDGEFLAILGSSGSGKSTLLRLISGLDEATTGSIRIGERDVTSVSPEKRRLAMVFQNYALFPHLDVAQNICFGLASRRTPRAVQRARLAESAELLGLSQLLHRKPSELSGGQRQRVALGRALVSGERLVLMDEPLSNLDAKLRAEMRTEIKRIQRQLDLTIIYVTHDQIEAMTMADRVMLLADGKVEQLASPEQIYLRPATVRVGSFIGSPPMNILELSHHPHLTELAPAGAKAGSLGVRPEVMRVAHADAAGTETASEVELGTGSVLTNELLGADRMITVTLDSAPTRSVVRTDPAATFPAEAKVTLSAPPTALHWYDPAGRRVDS